MIGQIKKRAGYEYLLAYKITVPIYDYTVEFCNIYIDPYSRTRDQMIQSARSGMQNIAKGNKRDWGNMENNKNANSP